jgi:hypothetical protein
MSDADLIQKLGGPAKVAGLLNLPKAGGVQRVHNWTKRGIPARVKLAWPHIFQGSHSPAANDSRAEVANG